MAFLINKMNITSIVSGTDNITGDKLAPSLSANKQNIVFSYADSQHCIL
ncbi:hypothetical protein THF1C08_1310001 [Vibrio jasicida]|uniref:Uncharacterized protein n=1 Tax=Vibrio jasicida TaxID=766224 RepID=A0AAU9QUJ7_9VIBR|nr:hypothetical protein THF1C08_1310001 [Vibrio jasicida]CAH1602476.1 hypothetical protein THF1A12_590004 [Vibrio jasicida]